MCAWPRGLSVFFIHKERMTATHGNEKMCHLVTKRQAFGEECKPNEPRGLHNVIVPNLLSAVFWRDGRLLSAVHRLVVALLVEGKEKEREERARGRERERERGGHAALCAGGATRLVHCFSFA